MSVASGAVLIRRTGPLPALVALVVLVVALTACRTDADVGIAVRPDGSGTVTVTVDLDAGAAAQLGDPAGLALEDLRSAGWRLTGPTARRGGLRIVAVRRFTSPDQLAAVLDEVGGARGVFRRTSLRLTDGFASSSVRFRTSLHLSGDLSELSDARLTELLGGLPLGRTPEELAAAGADSRGAGRLTVRVSLPGGVDESNGRVVDGTAGWSAPLSGGGPTDTTLTASAGETRPVTLLLVGVGVVALCAGLVVAVTARRALD